MSDLQPVKRYYRIREYCARPDALFTAGALRQRIKAADCDPKSSFRAVFKRVGGILLIDLDAIPAWIEREDAKSRRRLGARSRPAAPVQVQPEPETLASKTPLSDEEWMAAQKRALKERREARQNGTVH